MTERSLAERTLDAKGPAAPPRRNGELVFAAPWESRAFGMALALRDARVFEWDEFRRELIAEIAHWERTHAPDEPYVYYERWLAALERTLAAKGVVGATELEAREHELAARPAGHDH